MFFCLTIRKQFVKLPMPNELKMFEHRTEEEIDRLCGEIYVCVMRSKTAIEVIYKCLKYNSITNEFKI